MYKKEDDEKLVDSFERLERNISRCDQIIDELLDFSRVGNFSLQPMCLDSWLLEVLDDLMIPDELIVRQNLGLNDMVLQIDPDHLRRAIINIFENARHSMLVEEDPGELKPGACLIASYLLKDRIEMTITDRGQGIPDDVLPNIIEPPIQHQEFWGRAGTACGKADNGAAWWRYRD